jgi:hypothetical protein
MFTLNTVFSNKKENETVQRAAVYKSFFTELFCDCMIIFDRCAASTHHPRQTAFWNMPINSVPRSVYEHSWGNIIPAQASL